MDWMVIEARNQWSTNPQPWFVGSLSDAELAIALLQRDYPDKIWTLVQR